MKQKTRHVLILAVVVALVGVAICYIVPPGQKTRLGLDLRGGLEVVYQAQTTHGQVPSADEMDKTLSIIDRRVNGLGVSESAVQKQGQDQVSVSLPGIRNVDQALALVGKTAQLEFYDDGETRIAGPASTKKELWTQADGLVSKADLENLRDGEQVDKYRVIVAPPGVWGDNKAPVYFLYLHKPSMTGGAIKEARQGFDQFNRPNVLMDFTSIGGKQFEKVTKQLAIRGALKQQSQTFAIVLDDVMESDPQVDYQENPQGISGGSAEITGNFTTQEAKDLALVLNTGALPVTLTAIEKQQVSATLGADSLRAGLIAGAVGMALVLIFMIVVYRFLGVIADLALIIYAVLLWGVFNAVPVTLTLPGIAGMILTIGVAADANVVVFERIKEEVRRGKSVRSAINSGYGKGFRTILDANILILLTAVVLFYFATAQPKGFALTLVIGTIVSLFTAVLATRAMLGLLSGFAWFNKAEFMGAKPGELLFEGEFAWDEEAAAGGQRGAAARRPRPAAARRQPAPAAAAASAGTAGAATGDAAPAGAGGQRDEAARVDSQASEPVDADVLAAAASSDGKRAATRPKRPSGGKGRRRPPRKKKRR
jgi:preprotein translocase subunit SecD